MTNLESVATNELEGELAELPEVVPGQLSLLVVEGEGLSGHNPVRTIVTHTNRKVGVGFSNSTCKCRLKVLFLLPTCKLFCYDA